VYRAGPAGLELMGGIDPDDWLQTDLLRVVFSSNTSTMDPNTDGAFDYRYMIDAYDWTWDGISFPLPDTAAFKDMNRVTINHPDANHAEARVHNPASRTHTGLVAGFRPFGAGAAGLYVSATVQLYRRATWGWIGLSPSTAALSPGQARTLDATITVPLGTPVGTYEGALYVEGNVHFVAADTARLWGVPSGKLYRGSVVGGYAYGSLTYPMANARAIAEDLELLAVSEEVPVLSLRKVGAGTALWVNLPLGYLKAYSDDMPLRATLRTFLFDITGIPHLVAAPEGIGGLVIDWHIDSAVEWEGVPALIRNGFVREGLRMQFDVTAGPDRDEEGEGGGAERA